MKFSSQEEYGLRCLLRIAREIEREGGGKGLTIPEISTAEGMTTHNTAKLLRILRIGAFLESSRGQVGGYSLSRPADEILLSDVLKVLGGRLFDQEFCNTHSGGGRADRAAARPAGPAIPIVQAPRTSGCPGSSRLGQPSAR